VGENKQVALLGRVAMVTSPQNKRETTGKNMCIIDRIKVDVRNGTFGD
jgi:hypothetical protein